jgi:hypothetical protein
MCRLGVYVVNDVVVAVVYWYIIYFYYVRMCSDWSIQEIFCVASRYLYIVMACISLWLVVY